MGTDLDDRLRVLEEQLAQLTARIYRIERLLAVEVPLHSPQGETVPSPVPPIPRQGPQTSIIPVAEQSAAKEAPQASPASPSQDQLRRDSSQPAQSSATTLESVIGGQWLNRLGVIAVLVGLSYFLKLAIENNWVGPAARVAIGLVAGIGVVFWSERFRRCGFDAFSYSLKALGLGALYLSLWAAFQLYHLVPASSAFLGMVLVTMAVGTLSIVQQSELLAALALLGGFLTPILVSTHDNREVSLLSYLLLLDLGAVWVVMAKRWPRLLAGALVGTVLLFAGWAFEYYSDNHLATTCVFATVFFLVFAAAPLINSPDAEERRRWGTLECAVLAVNAAAYFIGLFAMMEDQHRQWLALMTFALSAVCLLMGWILVVKRARGDLETAYMILAIVFLTVAVGIQFNDRAITIAWDVEAAVLLWLSRQTHATLLRTSGTLVLFLAIARLTLADSGRQTTLVLNARFGEYLLTIAIAGLMTYIYVKPKEASSEKWAGLGLIAINGLALGALSLEVHDYFLPLFRTAISGGEQRSVLTAEAFSYSALWMLYGAALMAVGFWKRQAFLRWLALALLAITAIKVFSVDISMLERGYRIASFIALGVILLVVSFFYQRARLGGGDRIQRS